MRKILLTSAAIFATTASLGPGSGRRPNPSQGQLAAPYGAGPAANNNNNAWGIANTPTGSKEAGSNSTMYSTEHQCRPEARHHRDQVEWPRGCRGFRQLHQRGPWPERQWHAERLQAQSGRHQQPDADLSRLRRHGRQRSSLRCVRSNCGRISAPPTAHSPTRRQAARPTAPARTVPGQTVFVRRAFTYLASDNVGIVRFGQADGVIGLFDNCIFTTQCWDAGIQGLNGSGGFTATRARRGSQACHSSG